MNIGKTGVLAFRIEVDQPEDTFRRSPTRKRAQDGKSTSLAPAVVVDLLFGRLFAVAVGIALCASQDLLGNQA